VLGTLSIALDICKHLGIAFYIALNDSNKDANAASIR
jgi:hypothetical protein